MKAKPKRLLVKLAGWVLALSSLALIPWPKDAQWLWYPLLAVIIFGCSIALERIDNNEPIFSKSKRKNNHTKGGVMKFWIKLLALWLVIDVAIAFTIGHTLGDYPQEKMTYFVLWLGGIWAGCLFFMVRNGIHGFIYRKAFKNEFESAMYQILENQKIPYSYNGYNLLKEYYTSADPTDYFSEILMEAEHSPKEREAAQRLIGICNGYQLAYASKQGMLSRFSEGMKQATLKYAETKGYEQAKEELHS